MSKIKTLVEENRAIYDQESSNSDSEVIFLRDII
jgi:hypothetical protein